MIFRVLLIALIITPFATDVYFYYLYKGTPMFVYYE